MAGIGGMIRALLVRAAWLALAILVAFGGAGVIAAMDHVPGTAARPELTAGADAETLEALDRATGRLEALSREVEALGRTARLALTQVTSGDSEALEATIATGDAQVAGVEAAAEALRSALAGVPNVGRHDALALSQPVRHRYAELTGTADLAAGLADDWAALADRAGDAARLVTLLALHDRQAGAAAREGSAAHYRAALEKLGAAEATLAEAVAVRDRLASTTDVTTLTSWLDRNAGYDAALRTLYQSLLDADGRVTRAVREAFAAEQRAREALPDDTRGLVVIMAEVAQGGLNQAVISIEEARGALDGALLEQHRLQSGDELPG